MKNYLTVLNIITSSLLFGFNYFTVKENQIFLVFIWLLYTILVTGPLLFDNIWIKVFSALASAAIIIVSGLPEEIFLLISFQALIAARELKIPWVLVPALFIIWIPFIPREIIHIYIFISLSISVLEIIYSWFSGRNEHLQKTAENLAVRNLSLISEIDDSVINESSDENSGSKNNGGMKKLKRLIDHYSDGSRLNFMIYQNRNNLSAGRKTWNAILANCEEAIRNTIEHAEAGNIDIIFTRLKKILKVEITDNGKGCPELKPGEGLMRIDSRMSLCSGSLLINRKPSFSIIMLFPEETYG